MKAWAEAFEDHDGEDAANVDEDILMRIKSQSSIINKLKRRAKTIKTSLPAQRSQNERSWNEKIDIPS